MTDLDKALAFFDKAQDQFAKSAWTPPKGYFSVRQLAKKKGIAWSTMKLKLDRMVVAGVADKIEGRVRNTKADFYRVRG